MTNEYSSAPDLRITASSEADATVLVLAGEIDASSTDRFRAAVVDATAEHRALVIDLAAVTFMDSSGLSVLTHALNLVDEAGGKLTLRSPSPPVRRLLEITGLTDRFLGSGS